MSGKSVWNEKVKQDSCICYNCFAWIREESLFRGVMTKPGDVDSAEVLSRDRKEPTNTVKEQSIRRTKRRTRGGNVTEFNDDGRGDPDDPSSLSAQYGTYQTCECGVDGHDVVYKELTDDEFKQAIKEIGAKLENDRTVAVQKKRMAIEAIRLLRSTDPSDQFENKRHILKRVVDEYADFVEYEPDDTEFVVE